MTADSAANASKEEFFVVPVKFLETELREPRQLDHKIKLVGIGEQLRG